MKKVFINVLLVALLMLAMNVSLFADPLYGEDLIPVMTSNTTPSGVASASASWSGTPAWKAFDNITAYLANGTYNAWGTHDTSGWLAYEFSSPKTIVKYTILAHSNKITAPKDWTFEAWDGANWVVLDTRTSVIDWTSTKKEFTFSNTTAYSKYQINIFANNGSTSNTVNLAIIEMEMIEQLPSAIAAPINLTVTAGNAQVSLTWDAVTNATGYNVKRATTAGGPYTEIESGITTTAYTDNTAANGTTYYYTVTATNTAGESNPSNEVSATPVQPIVIPNPPANLNAAAGDIGINLTWDAVADADSYNIKRSLTAGGSFETVASAVYGSYSDTSVTIGTTYYYVVTSVNSAGESGPSNEVSAVLNSTEETITVEAASDTVNVGDQFTTDIVLHNAVNMCAEDFTVTYNTELFEYVGYEEVAGLKVYKEIFNTASPGTVRLIVASMGKQNTINGDKVMVKLRFKALKAGKDKIDVTRGRIANNGTIEKDILDANCGEKEITVKGILDVNRTGEFTLLDLGIDAWYYGDAVADTDTTKYDADVVTSGYIDNEDLSAIVTAMLSNPNYSPNN